MFSNISIYGNNFQYMAIYQEGYNKGYQDAIRLMQSGNLGRNQQKSASEFIKPQSQEPFIKPNITKKSRNIEKSFTSMQASKKLEEAFRDGIAPIKSQFCNSRIGIRSQVDDNRSLISCSVSHIDRESTLKRIIAQKIKQKRKQKKTYLNSITPTYLKKSIKGNQPLQDFNDSPNESSNLIKQEIQSQYDNNFFSTQIQSPKQQQQSKEPDCLLDSYEQEELFSHVLSERDSLRQEQNFEEMVSKQQMLSQDLVKSETSQGNLNQNIKKQRRPRVVKSKRRPFNVEELEQMKEDFQKLSAMQRTNHGACAGLFELFRQKYQAGKTTINKIYAQWQKDPSLRQLISKKMTPWGDRKDLLQTPKNAKRVQVIQIAFTKNPYLTNEGLTHQVARLLQQSHPDAKLDVGVSRRIMRQLAKRAGYVKKRYRMIAASRNYPQQIIARKNFCIQLSQALQRKADHIFFLNIDPMSINPYMNKDHVWTKSDTPINQILTKQFRNDYLSAILIVGKKYIEWQLTQGIIQNDQYVMILNKVIKSIYQYVQRLKSSGRILLIVNPLYGEDPNTNRPYIQRQSQIKLKVLESLCKSVPYYRQKIHIKVIPAFSNQLDLVNSVEMYIRQKNIHNAIDIKKLSLEEIRQQLWNIVPNYLNKLKDADYELLEKLWDKLDGFIEDGKSKSLF